MRVDVHLQRAQLELAQGNHDAALAAARTALAGAGDTDESESLSLRQDLLGQALAANGQTAEAEAAFRASVETIEYLRAETAGGEESRQATLQKHIDSYQRLVALLVADGKVADAFTMAESAKARVLRGILKYGRMDLSDALTDDEQFVTDADRTTVFMVGPGKLPLEARTMPIGAKGLHRHARKPSSARPLTTIFCTWQPTVCSTMRTHCIRVC